MFTILNCLFQRRNKGIRSSIQRVLSLYMPNVFFKGNLHFIQISNTLLQNQRSILFCNRAFLPNNTNPLKFLSCLPILWELLTLSLYLTYLVTCEHPEKSIKKKNQSLVTFIVILLPQLFLSMHHLSVSISISVSLLSFFLSLPFLLFSLFISLSFTFLRPFIPPFYCANYSSMNAHKLTLKILGAFNWPSY